MIDFHSHILPQFDDGSESMEMTLKMLNLSRRAGVDKIISTSHCYPASSQDIDEFVKKRDSIIDDIKSITASSDVGYPEIIKGCEMNLYTDISEYDNIKKACIEGTNYLLLEMPWGTWSDWMIECIYRLTIKGIRPVMAHIERFLDHDTELLEQIFELDVLYQVNGEIFLDKRCRRIVDMLIKRGLIHVIGSDMHNMESRRQNLHEARRTIEERYGKECFDYLMSNAERIINNQPIEKKQFTPVKTSFISKIFGGKSGKI